MNVSKHKDKSCDGGGKCRYRLNEGKFLHVSAVYIYIARVTYGVCCDTSYWHFSCCSITLASFLIISS